MKIKVVLLKDVRGLGKMNSIVSVTRGYAVHYLIPHELARIVSSQHAEKIINKAKSNEEIKRKKAEEEKRILEGKQLVFTAKAGENDKLFGSVTSSEISSEIKKVFGINVDKKKIVLETPIKKLGKYMVFIKLYKVVQADLIVIVEKET